MPKNDVSNFLAFPPDFFWGASTSAHQIEGGDNNDWTEWESKNCERLVKRSLKKLKETMKHSRHTEINSWAPLIEMASIPENFVCGKSCDHYNRYIEDFDIAKSLNMNAFRLSIDWARIEPEMGKFDQKEIQHYVKVIEALKERNIEPFVTLWHWPVPLWIRDIGGWENHQTVDFFVSYVKTLSEALKGKVKYIITINEPMVYAHMSYLTGQWPPCKHNPLAFLFVLRHLAAAHNKVYELLKKVDDSFQMSIATHNIWWVPYKNTFINTLAAGFMQRFWNMWFIEMIKGHFDFIGLNHYIRQIVDVGFSKLTINPITDFGWDFYPESIYHVISELKKYNKPIIITEHGIGDYHDRYRDWFITESLKWVYKAIKDGADVKGYLHWSLLDNFEWDKGIWPRFGLVDIDYDHDLKRTIRESAKKYAEIIKKGGLYE